MRRWLVLAFIFLLVAGAQAAERKVVFRVHLEANPRDGAVFAQPLRSLTGKPVYIEKTPCLSERDVKAFYPYRATDGSYGALLQFDDHGRTVLDTLSVERRGAVVYLFINGRPLTELQIDRRVVDGKIYLASGLTNDDIKSMAKNWKLLGGRKKK